MTDDSIADSKPGIYLHPWQSYQADIWPVSSCPFRNMAPTCDHQRTPAGIFSKDMPGLNTAFLWRTIVTPAITSETAAAPLTSADITELHIFFLQSSSIKTANGLPKCAQGDKY